MAKPILLTVDDDPQVLRAVERDLRAKYARDLRVVAAASGPEALEAVRQLKLRGDPVALLLVDQRMPGMSGVEFLERALDLVPDARRALLTAYADTDAAIDAINKVRLDHYILKPWDPPEERLYPILDDLLDDWWAQYRPGFEGLRLIGERWARRTHTLREFLTRNQVPYEFVEASSDDAVQLLDTAGTDARQLPVVLMTDGQVLLRPEPAELAERIGLSTRAQLPFYDLVIVGAGPAGLAAAVYGGSEGLDTLLVEGEAPGGQAGTSSRIENYLGFPNGLSGADLARRAVTQARRFGVELLVPKRAVSLRRTDPYRIVTFEDGSEVSCHALIVASGVSYRTLPADGVEPVTGAGLYYGASRIEAVAHEGQDVIVVGGGNSAGQAAMFLSGFAKTVTVMIRGGSLDATMSRYLIDQLGTTDNVTVRTDAQIVAVEARDGRLVAVTVEDTATGDRREVDTGAVFAFIGQAPRTDWLGDALPRDGHGFLLTGDDCGPDPAGWTLQRSLLPLETAVPGVFAVGDVRAGSIKRVASATGEGAMAVRFVHEHLAAL